SRRFGPVQHGIQGGEERRAGGACLRRRARSSDARRLARRRPGGGARGRVRRRAHIDRGSDERLQAGAADLRMEKKVFLHYTQSELDRNFDQRGWAKNALEIIGRYPELSKATRARFDHRTI